MSVGGVVHDITDSRSAEEQFRRAQRMENLGLLAAGIALASTQSQPNGSPVGIVKAAVERAFDLLPIFASLIEEERQTLAGKTKRKRYEKGDILAKPGDLLGSLFIIGGGVVSVTRVSSEGAGTTSILADASSTTRVPCAPTPRRTAGSDVC